MICPKCAAIDIDRVQGTRLSRCAECGHRAHVTAFKRIEVDNLEFHSLPPRADTSPLVVEQPSAWRGKLFSRTKGRFS
jgi:DNA-directed RNA polymerase subunit RPC12/RpoP